MKFHLSKNQTISLLAGILLCLALFFLIKPLIHQTEPEQDSSAVKALKDNRSESKHPKSTARSSQRNRQNKNVVSFFPQQNIEQDFVDSLDISSMRSSLGPRLTKGKNRLQDYLPAPSIENKTITFIHRFEGDEDHYIFEIKRRGDVNHDGIEDLIIQFRDGGTRTPALSTFAVTRTSASGDIVFLKKLETIYPAGGNGNIYKVDHNGRLFDEDGNELDEKGEKISASN